jgi:GNAT superfamily N-acetyltransferase
VDVTSLGFRTDLALLERSGSTISDRGDHLAIATPANPTFYWGNFLLLDHVPAAERAGEWLERFTETFPEARHRALGFDDPHGTLDDLSAFAANGLEVEASAVMTATSVHPPPHPNGDATYRVLESDGDWAQHVELQMACNDTFDSDRHLLFVNRRAASNRALTTAGHGGWFGAFLDGQLVAQMGLVTAGRRLARFQAVETHPDHRGRGLAGTLVHHVSGYGLRELGADTLVMVADPGYHAIRVYRSVGFDDTESQLQAQRAPDGDRVE